MLVEERCYVLKPDHTVADYLKLYEAGPQALQARILGRLLGSYVPEIGELNSLVQLWGYDSYEERTRRRALLATEPDWQAFLRAIRPMLQTLNNRLMVPTPFSPPWK